MLQKETLLEKGAEMEKEAEDTNIPCTIRQINSSLQALHSLAMK